MAILTHHPRYANLACRAAVATVATVPRCGAAAAAAPAVTPAAAPAVAPVEGAEGLAGREDKTDCSVGPYFGSVDADVDGGVTHSCLVHWSQSGRLPRETLTNFQSSLATLSAETYSSTKGVIDRYFLHRL